MTHAELKEQWAGMTKLVEQIGESTRPLVRLAFEMELRLYEMEGRGHAAHAEWLRAWLAGEHGRCAEILQGGEYQRELREQLRNGGDAHAMPESATHAA